MGEPYHGRNSLIILDLRPISHPFEPYAHQYGCMFDTMRYWKIKGIRPEGITEPEPVVDAPKTTETPKKTVVPQSTTTPRPATAPKPATTSKPTKTPGPVETPSRSSSGFSSYVSVNEELAASDSAESFDMVDEPVDPESSHNMGQATSRESPTNADHELSTNSGVAHPSSFVSSANGHNTVSTASSTLDSQDLTSVVSRLSLADEPYPDPDYSISGHLAANKVVGAVGRAQHSPPHGQRSPARREQTAPRKSDPLTPRKSEPVTPQRVARATPQTSPMQDIPHAPRTPQASTPDRSSRRKSKDHRRSSHAHSSPRTPELDTSPRSPDTSRRSDDRHTYDANGTPRSPQPLTSPRSPQPLADLTTDQRNIILCIQKAYHKVGPHEQWIGVYHGDIAKSHIKDDVVAQAASISNDIETLVDKGYLTTTVDEDHFDCRDHSHGRYRRYTEILADLSLDDD
ncbi:hypothetical protein GGG16DRAFT_67205 [Schizophyllum commune]|nr:hypothetical protein K525DRAFT_211171 [Schizophyllum commune Loenen D]